MTFLIKSVTEYTVIEKVMDNIIIYVCLIYTYNTKRNCIVCTTGYGIIKI